MDLARVPFRSVKYALIHPVRTIALVLLCCVTLFLATLQLSPEAQKHFNEALRSFGYSTASMVLTSSAEAALSTSKEENKALSTRLDTTDKNLRDSKKEISTLKQELDSSNNKNAVLRQQVATREQRIAQVDAFQKEANGIVKKHNVRLTKAVIKTTAGEVVAWVPIVGDVASVYFAIDGTVEMCNMFKELENTALKYGLPFYLYSGTFCEEPIKKSKAFVVDTTKDITDSISESLRQQSENRTNYWSGRIEALVDWWKE